MQRITFALAAVAALCMVIAVPTASAAKRSKTDKAQNKALKSYGKAIKKQRAAQRRHAASLKKQNAAVNTLTNSAKSLNGALNDLKTIADRADKTAAGITAGVPAIVKGLTDLRTGLFAAGAGLTSLRTLATSTEYGFAPGDVIEPGPTPNPQGTRSSQTPDIPDSVQQATGRRSSSSRQNTGTLLVAYGVRSAESDGTGAGDPAAACTITVTNEAACQPTTSAGNAALGGRAVPVRGHQVHADQHGGRQRRVRPFGLKTVAPDADVTQNLDARR